jgi:hypothetical protein
MNRSPAMIQRRAVWKRVDRTRRRRTDKVLTSLATQIVMAGWTPEPRRVSA